MMAVRLKRAFWSLYGRLVWDRCDPARVDGPAARIVSLLHARQSVSGEHVLDAGCGTGRHAFPVAQAGFTVTGVDYAPGMLAQAEASAQRLSVKQVSFRQASLDQPLPFPDGYFHHAMIISVLQVVQDPVFTLRELQRVLKPGGTLLLAHFPRPQTHDLPLRDAVRFRLAGYPSVNLLHKALIALKVLAERAGAGHYYWTADELQAMCHQAGFVIDTVEDGRPILIAAAKSAGTSGSDHSQPLPQETLYLADTTLEGA